MRERDLKALTILQPYAQLIRLGQKQCENRTWSTPFRGRFAVHAGRSKKYVTSDSPDNLEFGAVIATASLTAVVPMVDGKVPPEMHAEFGWLELDEYAYGPYCWVLENVEPVEPAVAALGQQGWWKLDDQQTKAVAGE